MKSSLSTPGRAALRGRLFQIAVDALEGQGWTVERIARTGKSSVRRISKGKITKTVTIRTSRDTWISFVRTPTDDAWSTLSDMDCVVAASVDDRDMPRFAQVHMIDGDEMRRRFDRAYAARKKAGHTMHIGRGIWLPLYEKDSDEPVSHVGGGAGLDHPAIARVSLAGERAIAISPRPNEEPHSGDVEQKNVSLTIPEAKRRLALSLGVSEGDIKITVSG